MAASEIVRPQGCVTADFDPVLKIVI